jgi:hypothetical protein
MRQDQKQESFTHIAEKDLVASYKFKIDIKK